MAEDIETGQVDRQQIQVSQRCICGECQHARIKGG